MPYVSVMWLFKRIRSGCSHRGTTTVTTTTRCAPSTHNTPRVTTNASDTTTWCVSPWHVIEVPCLILVCLVRAASLALNILVVSVSRLVLYLHNPGPAALHHNMTVRSIGSGQCGCRTRMETNLCNQAKILFYNYVSETTPDATKYAN